MLGRMVFMAEGGFDIDNWPNLAAWAARLEPMPGEGLYEWYREQAKAAAQPSKPQPAQTVPQPGSMEWLEEQGRAEPSGGIV